MTQKEIEDDVIKKINLILTNINCYEKPIVDDKGNILIKNKLRTKQDSNKINLTDIFKQIIANDIKKSRV